MTKCPYCGKKLIKRMNSFSFKGYTFGDFEASYCEECKESFFTEESMKKIIEISKEKGLFGKKYSLKEILLLIIGARERPVFGKTTLMKELFLMCKENPFEISFQEQFTFKPHHFGPYLFNFDDILNELFNLELINMSEGNYSLTDKGRATFKQLTEFWDDVDAKKLSKVRKSWDQKGTYGLMNYIYSNYPEFKRRSKVLDRFSD
ncbi:MAG: hypothetical protein KAU14_02975 [Thermoplasmata archaeon]|nr:hypothetical protein [Thermoplasmata archaeon]